VNTATVHHRTTCRLCESPNVELVLKLKPIPLSENYCTDSSTGKNAARYPVDVSMCTDCGHVQQLDVVDAKSLWDSYTYYSGEAKGMPEHFREIADRILRTYRPAPGSLVIDIGSNDGSLLRPFREAGYSVLGIDPAKEIARQATEGGIETLPELMSLELAEKIRRERGPAAIVCMFNAFAHADNMGEIAEGIRTLLADDGVFVFESQYLPDILDGMLIATIFHEHISHHSVVALAPFFERHGLELIDVARYPQIQHGSLVGFVQRLGGPRQVQPAVREFLEAEKARGLHTPAPLRDFAAMVGELAKKTSELAASWRAQGAVVAGYGAARSGPTLISQLGLTDTIQYIFDDHPQKVGLYSSGDGIPIIPTQELCRRMPDYTVILAWVHAPKIIAANKEYLDKGGKFVVLCPNTSIVARESSQTIL
jgi:SAM-dependent methyltransferase